MAVNIAINDLDLFFPARPLEFRVHTRQCTLDIAVSDRPDGTEMSVVLCMADGTRHRLAGGMIGNGDDVVVTPSYRGVNIR